MRLKFLLKGLVFSSFTMYFSCSLIVVQVANIHHILHSHNWKYETLKILIPHNRHALFKLSYICVKHRKESFAKFWTYNPKIIRSCSRFFIRKSQRIKSSCLLSLVLRQIRRLECQSYFAQQYRWQCDSMFPTLHCHITCNAWIHGFDPSHGWKVKLTNARHADPCL